MSTAESSSTVSTTDHSALVRAVYECFNGREFDRLDALVAEDVEVHHIPTGVTFRGRAGFRQMMDGWAGAFGDARCEDVSIAAQGDRAVAEFAGRGTHTGPFVTPAGAIPATGRRVDIRFCEVYDIRDGRIVRLRTYFDLAAFAAQLGIGQPEPAAAAGA